MKYNFHSTLLFGTLLLTFLSSCGSDTKVNFLLNEREFISVDATPVDQIDSSAFYEIYAGDTVFFKDVSEPQKDDRKRYWNLDGQEGWDTIDNRLTMHVYDNLGKVKVVLCVDNEENCTAKAILVKERPYVPVVTYTPTPTPPTPTLKPQTPKSEPIARKPELKFILPNVYSTNSPDEEFTIRVSVRNVSSKDDLTLLVNGREHNNFSLSGGQLTSKIPLKEGRNLVKLTAEFSGEAVSEEKEFMYSPGASATPSIGFIQPSTSTATTSDNQYDIVVATANIAKKDLTLTVGGQAVKDFSFNPSTGELKAKVPLKKGDNLIRVTAGGASTERTITLDKRGGIGYAAVLPKNVINSCDEYSVKNGSLTLTPKRTLRLMESIVYSSGCGSITITLSGGGEKASETFELTKGGSPLVFSSLDGIELQAGTSYTLTFSTGKSSDCPSGSPQLLNATSCGTAPSGDQYLNISYGGKASLFKIKYQY